MTVIFANPDHRFVPVAFLAGKLMKWPKTDNLGGVTGLALARVESHQSRSKFKLNSTQLIGFDAVMLLIG
jgi:hypothetical protein